LSDDESEGDHFENLVNFYRIYPEFQKYQNWEILKFVNIRVQIYFNF